MEGFTKRNEPAKDVEGEDEKHTAAEKPRDEFFFGDGIGEKVNHIGGKKERQGVNMVRFYSVVASAHQLV